jgi:hypothetical protein
MISLHEVCSDKVHINLVLHRKVRSKSGGRLSGDADQDFLMAMVWMVHRHHGHAKHRIHLQTLHSYI